MSIVDVDSWVTEYESCERLSRDIQAKLVLRNRERKLSDAYSIISGNIRVRLKQFSTEVTDLQRKLEFAVKLNKVTSEEAERRQRQIEQLESKLIHLQKQFSDVDTTARDELFRNQRTKKLWDDDEDDDEPIVDVYQGTSSQDLQRQHKEILADQDRGLDALSQVISRQKDLAIRIGDEVEVQNEIIDGLADTMDTTDARINRETRSVGDVSRNDATCGYYMIIAGLFAAILVVLFI